MMISVAQCPLFLAAMTKTVFGITEAYLTAVMAKRDSETKATHDALTGLWNRAGLMLALTQAFANAAADPESFALLYIDLDGFKVINDELGHAAGDDILRQASVRISDAVPVGSLVARLGGDEFVVIVPGGLASGDLAIGEAVIAPVTQSYRLDARSAAWVGASVGVARSDDARSAEQLLADADAALYRAKAKGKGCCVVADRGTISRLADQRAA